MTIAMARRSEAHMLWVFRSRPSITAPQAAQEDQSVTLPFRIFAGLQGSHPRVFILGRAVAVAMVRRSEAPMLSGFRSRPSMTAQRESKRRPLLSDSWKPVTSVAHAHFTSNVALRKERPPFAPLHLCEDLLPALSRITAWSVLA